MSAESIPEPEERGAPESGLLPGYAELHCLSNFSFQRGASHPFELVERAAELGYAALALTDECSVAGVVRAYTAARECGLKLVVGSEFACGDVRLVALARDETGWGNLCEFISDARRTAPKGEYRVSADSDFARLQGCEVLVAPLRDRLSALDPDGVEAAVARACAPLR
ncbi:PHP domain-containing protein, partial [Paracidovorax cattleyae]